MTNQHRVTTLCVFVIFTDLEETLRDRSTPSQANFVYTLCGDGVVCGYASSGNGSCDLVNQPGPVLASGRFFGYDSRVA
ncbi:hypothetical protein B0G71_3371 [Paraburkholderia sp. BL27I4N3]|uniref:hypothetical protein n=1 Tax=Paraburkholderia sp. BL25I1N1 TaxID=1938804 RepID=UPI000D3F0724|nr:hypothetical protein [Paraburkholderia sp. BL25I1N1]PRY00297.1 hypothetical protein B0G73_12174 [Paraburkholderia sp. BL25I1N1]REE20245.1 hypothetical protein B0G71_3371 [Paraburkholderia sp. BL27I4N3]RKR43042.1 hypothetical protein B0G82_0590 [Paraburkholderia sp. BL17N1]